MVRLCTVLVLFLRMFAFGGVALLALLWFGSSDDAPIDEGADGVLGGAAAFLSIRGMLAGMTGAGLFGAAALGLLHLPVAVSIAAAGLGAWLGNRAWRSILRKLRYFDRDHSPSVELLVGREGVLTVAAHSAAAPGIVQVTLGGMSQEYTALPDADQSLPEGAPVVVVRIESPSTVVVAPSPLLVLPPAQ